MVNTTKPSDLSAAERSRLLLEEHEPHGLQVESEIYAVHSMVRVPGYFVRCECGWRGWIMKNASREIKETFEAVDF